VKRFLDVGAHIGQTCDEVVKPRWGFDRIDAFEPMPAQYADLAARHGARVRCHRYGLAHADGTRTLWGDNAQMEASLFPDAAYVDPAVHTECRFVDAAEWLTGEVATTDAVWMKLNCEGAEVEILDRLLDTGTLPLVDHLLIDFDIRKVPGRASEADRILARLADTGYTSYHLAEDVMRGETHQDRIAAWLEASGA
jgi:FkbM family methyltransferase